MLEPAIRGSHGCPGIGGGGSLVGETGGAAAGAAGSPFGDGSAVGNRPLVAPEAGDSDAFADVIEPLPGTDPFGMINPSLS